MKIDFFDVDKFCEDLPAVTTSKIYASKRGFHEDGIFSQRIFGPVKNYSCGCGTYYGKSKTGQICKICGVTIANSNKRRTTFAKIELPFEVMNPIMYFILIRLGKVTLKEIINNLILSELNIRYFYDEKLKKYIKLSEDEEAKEGITVYQGLEGAYEICEILVNKNKDVNHEWKYAYDNFNKFYIQNVIVMPPAFRPTSKTRDVQKRDKMNDGILTLINFVLTKSQELLDTNADAGIRAVNKRNLQRYVFTIYDYVLTKLSKKTGLIRDSILGKRNDFSGRAVIAPDPTLELDQCSVPYFMLLELYKLEIANVLNEKRILKTYDFAISYIDDCIKHESFELYDIVKTACAKKSVILNRQPTLHRMGLLAFKVKPNRDNVIKIHPMACEPYNADFDGDQMAIYRSLYPDAEEECNEKLLITKNLLSPSTGNLITGVNQDIVLGLYLLTTKDEDEKTTFTDVSGNEHQTYNGRVQFNNCLPSGYPFINKKINKSTLSAIVNDIARSKDSDTTKNVLDNIKRLGLETTTLYGSTISLKGMKLSGFKKIVSSIVDDDALTINEKILKLDSDEVMNPVKKAFGYSDFIESGSRGSWDQAKQIILCRGYISNADGKIIETPVKNNFVHGLTKEEFFISSYGTRKGLLDTALNTGVSGYLTRKTVYGTANLELHKDLDDCGSTDGFILKIDDMKMARSIIGRWQILEDGKLKLISYENYHEIKDKIIKLRSPLFCNSFDLCKKCYGQTADFIHSKYIGILASQALGEVSTQLVLRSFHTSGAAQMQKDTTTQDDIVADLDVVRNILHGNAKIPYDQMIIQLYKIYVRHRNILLVHFESLVSQMMRIGNDRWRLNENRNKISPEISSILSVPEKESWLLALAFHKPKEYLIDGILNDSNQKDGFLEKIMTNQRI